MFLIVLIPQYYALFGFDFLKVIRGSFRAQQLFLYWWGADGAELEL
jgi:hypothetical protein